MFTKKEKTETSIYFINNERRVSGGDLLRNCWENYRPGSPMPPIEKTEKGKPYFRDSDLFLSISHSGAYWACAFSPREIGLDIQVMKNDPAFGRIGDRFFSAKESDYYKENQAEPEARREAFYKIWTKREALGKYLGEGFYFDMEKEEAQRDYYIFYFYPKADVMGALVLKEKEEIWIKEMS